MRHRESVKISNNTIGLNQVKLMILGVRGVRGDITACGFLLGENADLLRQVVPTP
jgi:hypothetical protein